MLKGSKHATELAQVHVHLYCVFILTHLMSDASVCSTYYEEKYLLQTFKLLPNTSHLYSNTFKIVKFIFNSNVLDHPDIINSFDSPI